MNNGTQKFLTKYDIITGLLCLIGMVPGIILYNRLPVRIPTNFDINNNPHHFVPKLFFVFCLPLIMMLVHLIFCGIYNLKSKEPNPKALNTILHLFIPITTIILESITVMFVMDMITNIGLICCLMEGIIFILVGNYLPKTQPNHTFGIKFPWTVADEDVWRKTHRFAGYMAIISGIVVIIAAFLSAYYVCLIALVGALIIPTVYSYIISRKK